jgi:hypothetical protein
MQAERPRGQAQPETSPPKGATSNRLPIVGCGASAGGRKVREKEVSWYSLRARPYFTVKNKVGGAVLVVNIANLNESSRP